MGCGGEALNNRTLCRCVSTHDAKLWRVHTLPSRFNIMVNSFRFFLHRFHLPTWRVAMATSSHHTPREDGQQACGNFQPVQMPGHSSRLERAECRGVNRRPTPCPILAFRASRNRPHIWQGGEQMRDDSCEMKKEVPLTPRRRWL